MRLSSTTIGTAGELRVASELLLRGFRPRLALVDDGVDIQLESGRTIQVKTALTPRMQGRRPTYAFSFQSGRWQKSGQKQNVQRMRADYAVCWCVEHDKFYVLPASLIGKRTIIQISADPLRPSMFDSHLNAWEALR